MGEKCGINDKDGGGKLENGNDKTNKQPSSNKQNTQQRGGD